MYGTMLRGRVQNSSETHRARHMHLQGVTAETSGDEREGGGGGDVSGGRGLRRLSRGETVALFPPLTTPRVHVWTPVLQPILWSVADVLKSDSIERAKDLFF